MIAPIMPPATAVGANAPVMIALIAAGTAPMFIKMITKAAMT